jgi:hypothetical protein
MMTGSNPEFEANCIRRILAGEKQFIYRPVRDNAGARNGRQSENPPDAYPSQRVG